MRPNPRETADLVTFSEEILNENFIFCAVDISLVYARRKCECVLKSYIAS